MKNFENKIVLTGCKWSSSNAPVPLSPVFHSGCEISISHYLPSSLWGDKNWPLQYEGEEVGKFGKWNWCNRLQMVQFECPRHSIPRFSLRLGDFHFPIFCLPLSGLIRIGLSSMKVKMLKNLENRIVLTGCKWSSLNTPGTQSPVSHSGWEISIFPFSAFLSLG